MNEQTTSQYEQLFVCVVQPAELRIASAASAAAAADGACCGGG